MNDNKQCECVGSLNGGKWDKMNESIRRVYSPQAASPSLTTCCGGNHEVKIEEVSVYDEQNRYLRTDGNVGTLTTDGSSPKHNNRIVEPSKDFVVWDGYNQQVRTDQSCVGTLTCNCGADLKRNGQGIINNFKIRKLTPRECFRLMGVKDDDFERVAKNQSDSSLYHLAGDSIITNCLMAIFEQML